MAEITDTKQVITFGKHKGKRIEQVLAYDPRWLIWAHDNVAFFKLSKDLHEIAMIARDQEAAKNVRRNITQKPYDPSCESVDTFMKRRQQ
jgi:hypothetical protein